MLRFRLYFHVKLEKQHICFNRALNRADAQRERERERERERGVRALGKRDLALAAAVSFRCIIFSFATSRIHKHIQLGHANGCHGNKHCKQQPFACPRLMCIPDSKICLAHLWVGLGIENRFRFQNRILKVRNRILVKLKFRFRLSIPFFFFHL